MSAPLERACAGFYNDPDGLTSWTRLSAADPKLADKYRAGMHAALSAALDRDELAGVLISHTRIAGIHGDCSCGHVVPLGHSFAAHQADALVAHLTQPAASAGASS